MIERQHTIAHISANGYHELIIVAQGPAIL